MLAPVNLRFAELIQALGLNKNAFAQSLGKTASVVQHLIDGRNKPGYDLLCKVFEVYPNVSKDWLMEGAGPMLLAGAPAAASAAFAPVRPAPPAVALKKTAAAAPLFATSAGPTEANQAIPAASVPPAPAPAAAVPPAAAPAPTAAPADAAIGAALQTQHLLHQLALAELRNQHLLEQQLLLRQLLEAVRGR